MFEPQARRLQSRRLVYLCLALVGRARSLPHLPGVLVLVPVG